MKAVLLSIRPEWCNLILQGLKTVEVRKTKPEGLKPPFKCYIYCTKEQAKMGWLRIVPGKGWQRLDGTVIGEFVCDKIWELAPLNHAPDDVEEIACMDRSAIVHYLNKCHGWAWHISGLKIYDQPRELDEFYRFGFYGMNGTGVCGNEDCKHYQPSGSYMEPPTCAIDGCYLKRPPQSWCYVEELSSE